MKKLSILISVFLILLTSIVFGAFPSSIDGTYCTNTPFLNDTFTYSDTYINHDWDAFSTSTFPPIPPNTPYKNSSFGYNGTGGNPASTFNHRLDFFHTQDYTSGTYVVSFDFFEGYDNVTSGGGLSKYTVWLKDKDSNTKGELTIGENDNFNTHEFLECVPSYIFMQNTWNHIDIVLNLDLDESHVYVNGFSYGCDNLNATVDELGGIQIFMGHTGGEGSDRLIDNVVMCQGTIIGNFTLDTSDTEDLAVGIENFWDTVGVKSNVSRFIFGLVAMILIAFVFFEFHIASKTPITTASGMMLIVIEFIVSILLVYLQLFPVWFIFLYGFFCGGIGFLIFKSTMGDGGG